MSVDTATTLQTYTCPNCGATTSFDPLRKALRCPFCGTEIAVRAEAAAKHPANSVPQYVLPFKLDRDASAEKIREWLGDSFFAPSDLKNRSAVDRGQGTYVPFWRFDAEADSNWEGEVSKTHTRQVKRSFTSEGGKQETRWEDEQYQTWHPRNGTNRGSHRTFVCGSTGLTQDEADKLMPFPETGMMTYSPDLLAGYSAEEPGVDENGAWQSGEPRIREMERDVCAKQVERLTKVDTRLSNRQSAVCYLPVWLYSYNYQGKPFRVLVNGYTGEIVGDRPVSKGRVVLVVGAVVVVIAIIVLMVMLFGG